MMKAPALVVAVVLAATPSTTHLHYQRAVTATSTGQACAVLDPAIYAHAQGSLADLRLRSADGRLEIPFVLTLSQAALGETEPAAVTNLRQQGRAVAFDLTMPHRLYTDVTLDLAIADFLATAVVSGRSPASTPLGSFTLFDLASRHLSRSTTLPLQESSFPVLHVKLVPSIGTPALTPAMVRGASVPPSREAQTLYTPALIDRRIEQQSQQSRAIFVVPPHLPIERVVVTLAPGFTGNFRRDLRISSSAVGEPATAGEQLSGSIDRVRLRQDGAIIRNEHLSAPATLGANLQQPAEVQVSVLNGAEPPLPITSIALETREHKLCFTATDLRGATLFYGDARLEPAAVVFARVFHADAPTSVAILGPEQLNPRYRPRADDRPLLKRHPRLVYLGLILLVCFSALFFLRSHKLRISR